ncbi:MAG: hypothetical protein HC866_26715 [Leptolyngbyaceae cyanobacterium RU_5_1]|nr:hypothetical protein [Leptolyngbyaceae cyanobacterium RU_5_1]
MNQTYSNLFRQARAYGFLAQVALAKSAWGAAKQAAETALQLSETAGQSVTQPLPAEQQVYLDWEKTFNRGWYLLSFGQAQRHLGQLPAAVQTLEAVCK